MPTPIALLAAAVAAAAHPAPAHGGSGPAPAAAVADTILRPDLSVPPLTVRAGLVADPGDSHVTLGLRRIPLSGGGGTASPLGLDAGDDGLMQEVLRWRISRWGGVVADSVLFLPPPPAPPSRTEIGVPGDEELPRFVNEYADLALRLRSNMELGGNWTRFQPCDEQFKVSCNPTLIPQLSPDVRFGVQVAGTIMDRIVVDVDFDQAREFDAANRINMVYLGDEDDILGRLEVGDVTFNLPASRFLTEGIPAGNFGFQAEGQLGPLEFQTVWAQQRGDVNSREFRVTGIGDQRGFVQEDTLVLDDADYVRGQFFFLVDPAVIDQYPHLDVLALDAASAPSTVVPGPDPIQLYRFEDNRVFQQQVEGFIQADAGAGVGATGVAESGWFRYLLPGVDYFVHPSGLWIALRIPLRREEMLAVTYVTAVGDTVGDYNPERLHNAGGRPTLRLLKASGANHQPGRPTWDQEMHQIYRVSGSRDVEEGSVELTISLGELSAGRTFKRAPPGDDITFLRLFGLDEESPADALDPAFVYSPGSEFLQDQPAVQGTFVVFPTLEPFAVPPPLRSLGLTALQTADILDQDANTQIYEEEDPFERDNAGRFRLTLAYRLRSQDVISSFSLGALGVRDGSERIFLGERLLTPGLDYEIDYDVGQVRLLEPEQLFATAPDQPVRATWEQRSLFQVSPTQVFGLRTHSDLGSSGRIDFLGLYQSERTVVTRPILGTEPRAALLGGVSGSFVTEVGWFDRILDRTLGTGVEGQTLLTMTGELATSVPNPNTRDVAFLDDFDAVAELPISLLSSAWAHGSAPTSRLGAESVLPGAVDASDAVPLVWQHSWVVQTPGGDSVGLHEGFFPRLDIDRQIRVAGSEVRQPGLIVSFGRGRLAGPSWRSMTTSLSTTGLDLTKTEFLEFYAAGADDLTLVIDLGTVSEDAFFVDFGGNTSGTQAETGKPWGLGLLDQEADPRKGEIWSHDADERGVWGEVCRAEPGAIYRIGDPRAICTRGNGRQDSEDLDGDGNLDVRERHLRYVVRLDGSSRFLARTRAETGTVFQLYRIPIRGTGAIEVGGAVSDADMRAVRHLRISVTGEVTGDRERALRLARMRLVGSRWIKRAAEGVLQGIVGDTLAGLGRMEVATISRVTEGEAYSSPPGVLEQIVDPTVAFAGQGIEFNEKSLGILFEDVPAGGRAEVYQRFPQRPRNFLAYRQARVWALARSGDFGRDVPHYFFLKVGSDSENFYLFRTPLEPSRGSASVAPSDWLPEVVIDFDEWFELRRRAEQQLVLSPPGPGDPPVTLWAADSTYAVVMRDRGRAPNLAAVRELSMGVWNEGSAPLSGELWINELRLGRAVRDAGVAGSVDIELDGAGALLTRLSFTSRGASFRQLRDDPTYQTDRTVDLSTTLRLERWMPVEWGLELPVTLDVNRTAQAPSFLASSDVRADRIRGLRSTASRRTRVGVGFRRRTPANSPVTGFLVDGLDARVSYTTGGYSTIASEHESKGLDASLGWVREPTLRDVAIFPGVAADVVRALLPGFLEEAVAGSRFRWTPERVSLGSSYLKSDGRVVRFERIVVGPGDTLATATVIPREYLESAANLRFRPLDPLTADVTLSTVRDLLPVEDAVSDLFVQELIEDERAGGALVDLGWETNRSIRTRLTFRPRIVAWIQNTLDWTTSYRSDRNASYVERRVAGADTTLELARNARGQREWRASVSVDPAAFQRAALGEPTGGESPDIAQLRSLITSIRPLRATYQDGIDSRFDRDPVRPGMAYQLGWGGENDFLFMDGDTAATLTDRSGWDFASGVGLPGGFALDLAYQWSRVSTLDTRSDRESVRRRWPDVRASIPALAPPSFTGIQRINASSGLVRSTRETEYGGRGLQRRFQEDLQVPLNISLTWIGTLVTSYQGAFRRGRGEDPTGDTEHDEASHRLSMSSLFSPPGGLARALDRPVRLSVIASYTAQRDCRTTTARDECVPFIDQIRRSFSLALDSSVGGFELSVQMSYDDRQSFVGQRTGSTQFQLGLFGRLQVAAGSLPLGPGM